MNLCAGSLLYQATPSDLIAYPPYAIQSPLAVPTDAIILHLDGSIKITKPRWSVYLFLGLVVLGALVGGALSKKMRAVLRIALLISALVVAALIAFLLLAEKPILMGDSERWFARTPWREVLSFLAMVLGMFCKYFWDLIELRRSQTAQVSATTHRPPLQFDFWDFIQPLLVAGIIFSGILEVQKDLSLSTFLFSFQNGFFWQAVLRNRPLVAGSSTSTPGRAS
jgi:hypothetical protein